MSLKTWLAEFYPIHAQDCPKAEALAHSILKWEGLQSENLRKHELSWVDRSFYTLQDESGDTWIVHSENCALCVHYASPVVEGSEERPCQGCPLYVVRDHVSCDDERSDELDSPWHLAKKTPSVMLSWLQSAAKCSEDKAGNGQDTQ